MVFSIAEAFLPVCFYYQLCHPTHTNWVTIENILCHTMASDFVLQSEIFFDERGMSRIAEGKFGVDLVTKRFAISAHRVQKTQFARKNVRGNRLEL